MGSYRNLLGNDFYLDVGSLVHGIGRLWILQMEAMAVP
jgi:hypothetical protein